eukprot:809494-Pyramimonas_sp.AAC.1
MQDETKSAKASRSNHEEFVSDLAKLKALRRPAHLSFVAVVSCRSRLLNDLPSSFSSSSAELSAPPSALQFSAHPDGFCVVGALAVVVAGCPRALRQPSSSSLL